MSRPKILLASFRLVLFLFCNPLQVFATCLEALDDAGAGGGRSYAQVNKAKFQQELETFFSKQSEPPYVAIGVLVELPDGTRSLALGDMLASSHDSLLRAFDANLKPTRRPGGGLKVLWSGEILCEGPKAKLEIKAVNHFVGSLSRMLSKGGNFTLAENDGAKLADFLEAKGITKPGSVEVAPVAERGQSFLGVKFDKEESLRHQFINRISAIGVNLSVLKRIAPTDPAHAVELREMMSDLNNDFDDATLAAMARLRRSQGQNSPPIAAALAKIEKMISLTRAASKKIQAGKDLSPAESAKFKDKEYLSDVIAAIGLIGDAALNTKGIPSKKPEVLVLSQ